MKGMETKEGETDPVLYVYNSFLAATTCPGLSV